MYRQSLVHSIIYGCISAVDTNLADIALSETTSNADVADLCWSNAENSSHVYIFDPEKIDIETDQPSRAPMCYLFKSLRSVSSCTSMSTKIISAYGLQTENDMGIDISEHIIDKLIAAVQAITIGNLANQVFILILC